MDTPVGSDGVSLWVGGSALVAIAGLIGAWIKARFSRQPPQPFEISSSTYDNLVDDNTRDHEAIFTRLNIVEKAVARHDGLIERVVPQLDRIENKVDRIVETRQ